MKQNIWSMQFKNWLLLSFGWPTTGAGVSSITYWAVFRCREMRGGRRRGWKNKSVIMISENDFTCCGGGGAGWLSLREMVACGTFRAMVMENPVSLDLFTKWAPLISTNWKKFLFWFRPISLPLNTKQRFQWQQNPKYWWYNQLTLRRQRRHDT